MKIKEVWVYFIIIHNLFLIVPSFIYKYGDANLHWALHLLSLSASRLYLPLLLIWIIYKNRITFTDFIKYYSGLLFYAALCFLYFPTYLSDLVFIDKYDWFTLPIKVMLWMISAGFILTNLIFIKKKEI